nr:RNA-directed DNA polymerase, eukaryota [Tanacetum cinerariifolium]
MVEESWKSSNILETNDLHDVNSIKALDIAQKAKVRWSIEEDENFIYSHGILNKKDPYLQLMGFLLIASGLLIRAYLDNTPRINRGTGYDNEKVVNVSGSRENVEEAGIQLSVDQADWRDDTNDEPEDQELEAQEHHEQPESINDTYPHEQDEHNIIIDSLDMSHDREQDDQDDNDDLAKERDLLAS